MEEQLKILSREKLFEKSLVLSTLLIALIVFSEVGFSQIVVNEVFPNAENTESGDGWIEIYNNGNSSVSLDDLVIQEASNPDTTPGFDTFASLSGTLEPNEFLVVSGSDLDNAGDIIRIFNTTSNSTLDEVAYGNANSTNVSNNALAPGEEESIGRFPDGSDTGIDNIDFRLFKSHLVTLESSNLCPVYNLNKNECHGTIQEAIDAASSGNTLNVSGDDYSESIVVDKSLTILGPGIDSENPAVIGSECDITVDITADNVTIKGLILEDDGGNCYPIIQIGPGISGVTIQNNEISYGYRGVTLMSNSNNNTILNNSIHNNDVGISVEGATDNTISGNTISNNGYGIELTEVGEEEDSGVEQSGNVSNNLINQNDIFENDYGLYGRNNIFFAELAISSNIITNNFATGIYFEGLDDNDGVLTIDDNEITGNEDGGIYFSEINNVSITNNKILDNSETGIYISSGSGNEAHFNNIAGNDAGVESYDEENSFNAIQNWWGDPTGPFNDNLNPDGQGDSISGNVDFIPWCTNEACDSISPNLIDTEPSNNILLDTPPEAIIFTFTENISSFVMMIDDEPVSAHLESITQVIFNDTNALNSLELGDHEIKIIVNDTNNNSAKFEIEFTLLPTDSVIFNETIEGAVEDFEFEAEEADTSLIIDTSGSTDIFIASIDEPLDNVEALDVDKFTEITVSNLSAIVFPLEIRISYRDAEISRAGADESSLRIYFFNETNRTWQLEPNTSVDTANNFVRAFVNHLSTFGAYGSAAPPTPKPVISTQSVQGGSGCIFDYSLTVPSNFDGAPNSTINVPVTVSNKGTCSNYVTVSAKVPSGWVARNETTKTLHAGESETVSILVTIPSGGVTSDISFSGIVYFNGIVTGKTRDAMMSVNVIEVVKTSTSPSPSSVEPSQSPIVTPVQTAEITKTPELPTGAVVKPQPSTITGFVTTNPFVSVGLIAVVLLGIYISWQMLKIKTSKGHNVKRK